MMHFVHAIHYKNKKNADGSIKVCEKVFSIKEDDDEKLDALADKVVKNFLMNEEGGVDWIFAGVRKIIRMADSEIDLPNELVGIQMTESIFEVNAMTDVENLVQGEMVELMYKE